MTDSASVLFVNVLMTETWAAIALNGLASLRGVRQRQGVRICGRQNVRFGVWLRSPQSSVKPTPLSVPETSSVSEWSASKQSCGPGVQRLDTFCSTSHCCFKSVTSGSKEATSEKSSKMHIFPFKSLFWCLQSTFTPTSRFCFFSASFLCMRNCLTVIDYFIGCRNDVKTILSFLISFWAK